MSHPIKERINVVLFLRNATGMVNASKAENSVEK